MISRKKFATFAAVGVTGISLVGLGAGASFTDHAQATQNIHAGRLAIEASVVDGSGSAIPADVEMTHKIAGKEHNAAVSVTLDNTGSAFDTGERYVEFTNVGTLPARPTGCGVDPAGANDSPLNTEVTLNWFGVQTVDWLQTSSIACFGDIQPGERWRLPFRFVGSLSNDSMGQSISPTLYMDFGEVPAGLAATEKPHVAAGDGQTFDIIVD